MLKAIDLRQGGATAMMAIDAAALVAVLGVAVWAGLPRPGRGSDGATAGGGLAYWGPFPGDGDRGAEVSDRN
jgi:hypothetical protein